MRNKRLRIFSFSVFISLILLLRSNYPVFATPLEPVPVAQSPFGQADRYRTDLFSGSATYNYPIKVPKGTNDLTPDVSLSYNHASTHDFGSQTGDGWELSRDYIQRDVNFTPASTTDDKFKLHFKGQTYDLVYVSSDSLFHTKVESHLKIQQFSTGGQGSTGIYWQVTTTDGTVYRFGYASNSEFVCNGQSYDGYWNLDQVQDIHSNHIYYTYTSSSGVSYLSQIKYNTDQQREIDFNYATNSYQRQLFIQGCSVTETSRLSNIQVKASSNLVHQYDLSYNQATNNQNLLHSITEKGSDGSSLPPTTFDYKSEVQTWQTSNTRWLNNVQIPADLKDPNTRIMDVNGDGLPDLLKVTYSGTNVTWNVYKNTGTTWNTSAETWINNASIDARPEQTDVRILDVNGDGLPDIVKTSYSGSNVTWKVYKNTGTSWNTTPELWINNAGIDVHLQQDSVTLADINGDGLPDIVKTFGTDNTTWDIFYNTGTSWNTTQVYWYNTGISSHYPDTHNKFIDVNGDGLTDVVRTEGSGDNYTWKVALNTGSSLQSYVTWINNAPIGAGLGGPDDVLTDVNGDGLPDIVQTRSGTSGCRFTWRVLMNLGNSWSTSWVNWMDNADTCTALDRTDTILADANGDGLSDVVKTSDGSSSDRKTWDVWYNNGNSPDLLATITTSQGGTISFNYTPSTTFDNTGGDSLPDLPFPMWVLQQTTINNGMTNSQATNDVTAYSYKNGLYNWQNKEFRGFGEVDETDPNGAKKQIIFNQDDALKGTTSQAKAKDSSSNPYTGLENIWSIATSSGVFTVNLASEKNYTYDGSASNPKITENDYQYDAYGNITKKSELGDTSTSSDDRFLYNEYNVNTTAWIVNTLKHTYANDSDDATKKNESWIYYDGNTSLTTAPTKGDVTKKENWLSGGTDPVSTYAYDSYGNKTSETDANGHTTTSAFGTNDTTYTYPDSTTNAKSQTTAATYDLGTGNVLTKTDPSGNTTTYTYDVFGRITKEIRAYDSSTYPTKSYQYFFDGVAPEGVLVSQRKVSGASGTYDSYAYTDGLGRTIQTRSDAEDTSKQTVKDTLYDKTNQIYLESIPHLDTLSTTYTASVSGIKNTSYTYDPIGRVTAVKNPKGDSKTIAYDHWKETITDENGHVKKQYKNAFGKINKVEEVNGGSTYTTLYTYNFADQLLNITDNTSHVTTLTYDTLGRKISQVDPDMGTWTYGYDAAGNLTQQTDNRGVVVSKLYDELNRLTKTDYPTNIDSTFLYDGNGKIGTLSIATDSAGTVNYFYDNRLRKTKESRTVSGTTKDTQYSYDAADRTTTQTNPDGEVVSYAFNAQGEIHSASGSASILNNIDYDALGRITKKDFPNGLSTNYTYSTTDLRLSRIQTGSLQDLNYTYDNVGNVSSITDGILSKTQTFGYDALDRLQVASESGGFNSAYGYDSLGNLTSYANAGNTTNYTYAQNGKAHAMTSSSERVSPVASSSATPLTSSLVENWNSGGIDVSKWMDWSAGQASVVSQQLKMDTTTYSAYYGVDSGKNTAVYDLTGSSIVNQLVSAGNLSLNSYEVYPLYAYVAGDPTTQYMYFISGTTLRAYKKVSGTNTVLATTTFNATNHKWFRIRESGGTTYFDTSANGTTWTNFTSTANAFTVTSLVVGSEVGTWNTEASTTSAIFDNFNYITPATASLADDWSAGSINSSFWSDWSAGHASVASSQLTLTSTTSSAYFGVDSGVTGKTYNLTDSYISTQLISTGNLSLNSYEVYPLYAYVAGDPTTQYMYFISGTTLRAYKKVSGTNTVLRTATFDAAQEKWFRIRESGGMTYFDTSPDGNNWVNFTSTVNAFNVTSLVVGHEIGTWNTEASTTAAVFSNFNYRTPSYLYDANGNMTSDGKNCYDYNEANQLVKVRNCGNNVTVADYIYDYNGNRMVKKTYQVSGTLKDTTTSWTDSYETKVVNGGSTTNTSYYFVNGQLIAKKNPDGSMYYFQNDQLGSASTITNSGGTLVENTKYDPWGEVLSGGTKSKFLYTGQEKDSETSLNYYNARFYDSHMRRFIQPDDVIQDIYNPQALNRYSYVLNNPLRYTDPTGNSSFFSDIISPILKSVGSFISKLLPKPASNTSAPAKNIPGLSNIKTTVSGLSVSGNNPIAYTKESPITNYINAVKNNGYVDLKGSVGSGIGIEGGVMMSKQGITQHVSGSIPSEGISASVLFSTKPVKQHAVDYTGFTVTGPGISTEWSFDPQDPLNIKKYKYEAGGVGCCGSIDFEYGVGYTGKTYPYTEKEPIFRSKELKDFYE